MKKIAALLCVLMLSAGLVFADEAADEYDDGYVYDVNGSGDQFLKISLFSLSPLNFKTGTLNTGAGAEIGYYRFLTKSVAVGGDVSASFNITVGKNALTMIPFTMGILWQPTFGKFEFPVSCGIGVAYQTVQNASYFPGPVLNTEAGAFFRFNEMWSFGGEGKLMVMPEWWKKDNEIVSTTKVFAGGIICARYHF